MSIKFLCLVVLLCATQSNIASEIMERICKLEEDMLNLQSSLTKISEKDVTCVALDSGIFVRTDGCKNNEKMRQMYAKTI